MARRGPAERSERTRARHRVIAQLQVGLAAFWVLLALNWWVVDEATWQPPVFTVLGGVYLVSSVATLREQRRRHAREQGTSRG